MPAVIDGKIRAEDELMSEDILHMGGVYDVSRDDHRSAKPFHVEVRTQDSYAHSELPGIVEVIVDGTVVARVQARIIEKDAPHNLSGGSFIAFTKEHIY